MQFQPDTNLYDRLFSELLLYIRQYKPPHRWRLVVIYPEEIAAMFRMSNLKETKFYQEVFTEGMQEAQRIFIQRLVARGTSVAEIAQIVDLSVAEVEAIIAQSTQVEPREQN